MNKKNAMLFILLFFFLSPVLAAEPQDVSVDFALQSPPVVGTPTELSFTFNDPVTGEPLRDIRVKMDIVIIEDALTLFSGDFYLPDGKLGMTYHFQDATEHSINLVISPAPGSKKRFQEVSKTFLVAVKVPEPPTAVWFKTLLFLVGLLVTGIVIGYYAVRARAKYGS